MNMVTLKSELDFDYGRIKITISLEEGDTNNYELTRADLGKPVAILNAEHTTFIDNTVEQGITYMYYTGGAVTMVQADFEDIFLSDSEHSLRIRFNPKVNSFKTTLQEQKIDTIGGKFPFFVRNGNLKYREIPIGGLISYEMDDYFEFGARPVEDALTRITTADSQSWEPMTPARRFYTERQFKLAVQDWLMNGKPKLFRSPTEGNYIIRLMNVSLSPEEKLSRMLHSFTATGYEVADYTWDNLKEYKLIPDEEA